VWILKKQDIWNYPLNIFLKLVIKKNIWIMKKDMYKLI
jgi:hypothetical protein